MVVYSSYNKKGLGLKRPFKGLQGKLPAVSRDVFNQTKWLRVPSNLALHGFRQGFCHFSGPPVPVSRCPHGKAFLPCI